MIMWKFLSERMHPEPPPNVLISDVVPDQLRNQIGYLINEYVIKRICSESTVGEIVQNFGYKKGFPTSEYYEKNPSWVLNNWIKNLEDKDLLDLLDFIGQSIFNIKISNFEDFQNELNDLIINNFEDFQNEVNDSLIRNSMGYKMVNG